VITNIDTLPESFIKARRELILDHCFFGSLIMKPTIVVDPDCESLWVDGNSIGINPEFFDDVDPTLLPGILAHNILHCVFDHHTRRGNRDAKIWNDACDYVVNLIAKSSGFRLPLGTLLDYKYKNMSAEAVYDLIYTKQENQEQQNNKGEGEGEGEGNQDKQNQDESQGSNKGTDNGATGEVRDLPSEDGQGQASESEKSENSNEWKLATQQAVMMAEAEHGDLPGYLKETVDKILQSKIDWKEETKRFFQVVAKDDETWSRPNRNFISQDIYLPSAYSVKMGEPVIAVDASSSITSKNLEEFNSHINHLIEQLQPELTHTLIFDTGIKSSTAYSVDDLPIKMEFVGRGGTDFRPIFSWIEKSMEKPPACLIVLTDLLGPFPDQEPDYPVLWVCTLPTIYKMPPFGEIVLLGD
jgi:predicted metal-dependent peptidase